MSELVRAASVLEKGADLSETALEIPQDLSEERWLELGEGLRRIGHGYQWWIGDWLVAGEKNYGSTYTVAASVTGIDESNLRIYKHVAHRVEKLIRINFLSWSHHRIVADLPSSKQAYWLNRAVSDSLSVAELSAALKGKPHVANNSGDNEWYTPDEYITAARKVMGAIDLDPASSTAANEIIRASTFFTAQDNGLEQTWHGRVWMNPPYAQPLVGLFADRVARAIRTKEIEQACVLVNNATETEWFFTIAGASSCVCFPKGRIRFWHPDKSTAVPLQGQAILYLGGKAQEFQSVFSEFGITAKL